jgi:ribosome-dependent ATPase
VSVGTFTKALGMASLYRDVVALAVIALIYFSVSVLLLKKQED